jgi:hypothetical protein
MLDHNHEGASSRFDLLRPTSARHFRRVRESVWRPCALPTMDARKRAAFIDSSRMSRSISNSRSCGSNSRMNTDRSTRCSATIRCVRDGPEIAYMTVTADPDRGPLGRHVAPRIFHPFIELGGAAPDIGMRRARPFQVPGLKQGERPVVGVFRNAGTRFHRLNLPAGVNCRAVRATPHLTPSDPAAVAALALTELDRATSREIIHARPVAGHPGPPLHRQ